jgi:hypothetical protein
LAPNYSLSATAYTQNGAKQTCESHTSAPRDLAAGATLQPISFNACE